MIMIGVASSGKSTLIKQIAENQQEYCVVSADSFWIRPNGTYDFNFKLLGEAHKWCKDRFDEAISDELGFYVVFVDNTNLTIGECSYYIAGAINAGYQVLLIDMKTDLDAKALSARNIHNVPEATIQKMLNKKELAQSIADKYIQNSGIDKNKIVVTDNLQIKKILGISE